MIVFCYIYIYKGYDSLKISTEFFFLESQPIIISCSRTIFFDFFLTKESFVLVGGQTKKANTEK